MLSLFVFVSDNSNDADAGELTEKDEDDGNGETVDPRRDCFNSFNF